MTLIVQLCTRLQILTRNSVSRRPRYSNLCCSLTLLCYYEGVGGRGALTLVCLCICVCALAFAYSVHTHVGGCPSFLISVCPLRAKV